MDVREKFIANLQEELAMLSDLLAEVPEGRVIDRYSLLERQNEAKRTLEEKLGKEPS
jgi:hypothetical protein